MGDHFVLMVDRLLTESTLEAAIEGSIQSYKSQDFSPETKSEVSPVNWNSVERSPVGKLVECRICQDEDEDCNIETPCSCCGSLKYAHRRCVQRWCNEKGDTVCEICLQQFKPGYTAPPQLFHYGGIPMNFRGNWEITRRDRLITMVATDRSYDDEYSASTARSLFHCRSVAFIFMILLVLRHTLPIIISENQSYSFTVLAIVILRIAGIVVPIYVMIRALSLFQHRRRRQYETRDRELPVAMSEIGV